MFNLIHHILSSLLSWAFWSNLIFDSIIYFMSYSGFACLLESHLYFYNQFSHTPRHLMYMQDFESRHGVPPRSAEVPLHLSPDVELTLRFTYDKITAL